MNNFLKEKIIIPSWDMIRLDSEAKKFYFIPGILSIIFLTTILVYQTIYTYVKLLGRGDDIVLKTILSFFETKFWLEVVIAVIIFLILYFIFIPIFDAGLVKYIDRKYKQEPISKIDAFGQGIYKFLQIFEYNNIISPFKILSIINSYLFIIRLIGIQYIQITSYIFLIILFFGTIMNILFSYTKFFIILENKGVFESIGESTKLTMLNPKITINLFFLIFILNLRVVINFIVFLIFPILIVSAITYISIKFLMVITIVLLVTVFVFMIFFIGYLTAVLEVFNTSLWYRAYIYGKQNSEK